VDRYTHLPRRQPSYREQRSHEDFLVNLDLPRALLIEAVRSAWLPADQSMQLAAVPEDLVRELVRTKFAERSWIERL
jgi:lipoate-protein ligase A